MSARTRRTENESRAPAARSKTKIPFMSWWIAYDMHRERLGLPRAPFVKSVFDHRRAGRNPAEAARLDKEQSNG